MKATVTLVGRYQGLPLRYGICVMTNGKELFERRKDKRFHFQDGAFAVLRPYSTKLGQIIRYTGLAYGYKKGWACVSLYL